MSKKIMVLIGSPRKGGNTEILADAFIKGAESVGNQVYKLCVADLNVKGCVDCQSCVENQGQCVQKDDMNQVYSLLYTCDMIVFASPVYYYGFTSQIKAVIDRFFVSETKPFTITTCGLLAVYADTDTSVCKPIVEHYKGLTGYLGLEDKGILTVEGVEAKGDITENIALEKAEAFGKSVL